MNTAGDKFLKLMMQALRDGWVSLGAAAWVVAGLLLLFGVAAGLFLWRWIGRGGLSRRAALGGPSIRSKVRWVNPKLMAGLLAAVVLGCSGCQTFSLTQEQWELQQRGGMVDPAVGNAVGAVGSVGALAGAITGAVLKK